MTVFFRSMQASKIHSKTVLVTGCSSGIGECVANFLREVGWDVFPTARSESDLQKLCSNGFDALQLDLNDSISIDDCVSSLMRKSPLGIGAIVNNAGIAIPGAVEDLSRDDLRKQFEVNVFGHMLRKWSLDRGLVGCGRCDSSQRWGQSL